MELENKVSLVTGAGQGIGEGIAKVLASHGSKVMIVDLNGDSANKVAKEINSLLIDFSLNFSAFWPKSQIGVLVKVIIYYKSYKLIIQQFYDLRFWRQNT